MIMTQTMGGKPIRTNFRFITDGNSWVEGYGASNPATKSFPAQLAGLLIAAGKTVTYQNFGVSGQNIDAMVADAATQIDPLVANYDILIGLELINQFYNTTETKEVIYNKYKSYFLARKAAGFICIACTPTNQGALKASTWREYAQYFTDTILAEFPSLGIYVADLWGQWQLQLYANTTYFIGDNLHKTDAGQLVEANTVYNVITKI